MPELPDVETFRKYVHATSLHKTIKQIKITNTKILKHISKKKLSSQLTGKQFTETKRHGKHLFIHCTNEDWLMMHFGMTGKLQYYKDKDEQPAHARLICTFDNGYNLAYDCQRLLGNITLTSDIDTYLQRKELGTDALKISWIEFNKRYQKKRGSIKSALMDQNTIAGVGNIYSDEILFQAGIHPKHPTQQLTEEQRKKIYSKMKYVLDTAIDAQADPSQFPDTFIIPHRRTDRICPKGSEQLQDIKVSGRTAYFCPKHQNKV